MINIKEKLEILKEEIDIYIWKLKNPKKVREMQRRMAEKNRIVIYRDNYLDKQKDVNE